MNETREDKAIVLDFLVHGYPFDKRPTYMKTPIAQAIGTNHFTLVELVPKKEVFLKSGDEVYIGAGKREQIHHISSRIDYEKLTETARTELEYVLEDLVELNQEKFIDFINKAMPLSARMHQLELLPGLGKKHMWEILEKREEEKFKDFDDLKKRVSLIPNPQKVIVKRIILELEGKEKHNIFVAPKIQKEPQQQRFQQRRF